MVPSSDDTGVSLSLFQLDSKASFRPAVLVSSWGTVHIPHPSFALKAPSGNGTLVLVGGRGCGFLGYVTSRLKVGGEGAL
jgi:hypothetical protein